MITYIYDIGGYDMKVRLLASTLAAMTLLLTACGQKEQEQSSNNQDNQKESKTKQDKKENHSNHKESSSDSLDKKHKDTKTLEKDVAQLAPNEKVALALFEPAVSDMAVTANELLNHSFRFRATGNVDEQRPINIYKLNTISPGMVTNIPQGTTFYVARPGKGGGVTLIGVSNNQVIVTGGQAASSYQQLVNESFTKIYNIKDLYQKYGSNPDFKKVASMIEITNAPINNNQASQSANKSESTSSGETVTRANVIDKVEAYEGHKLDTSKYTYKEPEQMGDGRWGFSILDKAGNLEGSYIINADGSVEKYDAKGRRI